MFTPTSKRIGVFFLRLSLIYVLLVIHWPGLRGLYGKVFCGGANLVFGSIGSKYGADFAPRDPGKDNSRVTIVAKKNEPPYTYTKRSGCIAWQVGYLPTATTAAFILATPIPWSRRWKAFLLGMLLVHLFVAARIALALLDIVTLTTETSTPWVELGPWLAELMSGTREVVLNSPASMYLPPIFIWMLVTFRRGDWALPERSGRPPRPAKRTD